MHKSGSYWPSLPTGRKQKAGDTAMALRPFVIKTAFYLPTGKGRGKSLQSAVEHLNYMGDPDRHCKHDEELLLGSAAIHAKYMTERPGVSGYFGPDPRCLPDVDQIQEAIRTHTGPVWRTFVSVTETDAVTLGGGLLTREGWEQAARAQIPQMLEKMGLDPANVEWVASVHKKAGHPHLHVLWWERAVTREKGVWSHKERIAIRRGWVTELYRPERERLGQEKSALRQSLIGVVRNQEPGFITPKVQAEWQSRLAAMAERMPGDGRVALKFMPPELKVQARETAEWLCRTVPRFKDAVTRYGDIAVEMAQHYSDKNEVHAKARANAEADLTDRVAQIVIQQAAQLNRQIQWQAVRDMMNRDDPATRHELLRISRLTGDQRRQAIANMATQLRGEGPQTLQRPLERRIANSVRYIHEARQQQAAIALRGVFAGMQSALRQAERDNVLAAKRREWERAKAEWEDAQIRQDTGLIL